MEQNSILVEYYDKFNELPPMITMGSYDDEDYKKAMISAIYNNEKITEDNIDKYFHNNYDLVDEDKKEKEQEQADKKQASKLFDIDLTDKEEE